MPRKPPTTPHPRRRQTGKTPDRKESAHKRGYGSKWRKARKEYLAAHPVCNVCKKNLSTEVDHIIPHRGDMKLFWDIKNNVQAICHSCHSEKTAKGR